MSAQLVPAALIAAAFLLGSIPFGLLIARARGVDLRQIGSGNIGATNAARALGRRLGALVLLLDTAKAYLPVTVARALLHGDARAVPVTAAVGLAAFLGHCYSPWLRLKGGKGVATALGVFLAISPLSAALSAAIWVGIYLATRISSVGSLVATGAVLPILWLRGEPADYVALAGAMYVVICWRHRANIRRLLRREETRV